MPDNAREARGGDQREEVLQALLGRPTLVRLDSMIAEKSLFEKLSYQVSRELVLPKEKEKEIPAMTFASSVAMMVHSLLRHNTSTTLGHIVSPQWGRKIVVDRIIQACEILIEEYKSKVYETTSKILDKKLRGEDFEGEVRELIEYQRLTLIAMREVINRYVTLFHINMPSPLRPPLANVKIGYEAIHPQQAR